MQKRGSGPVHWYFFTSSIVPQAYVTCFRNGHWLVDLKISKFAKKGVFFAFNQSKRTSYSLPRLSVISPWHWLWAFQKKKWWGGKAVNGEWIPLRKNTELSEVLWVWKHNFCISVTHFLALKGISLWKKQ